VPTSGGITQARQRLGYEPLKELFAQVAVPVAEEETGGRRAGLIEAARHGEDLDEDKSPACNGPGASGTRGASASAAGLETGLLARCEGTFGPVPRLPRRTILVNMINHS
jgi:hypothetical protein